MTLLRGMLSKVSARVDEDLLVRFRRAVLAKHGQFHGNMRREVEAALRHHAERMEQVGEDE